MGLEFDRTERDTGSTLSHDDGHTTVGFREDPAEVNPSQCQVSGTLLGCTHVTHNEDHIFEADIDLNSTDVEWWTGIRPVPSSRSQDIDLWSVVAHELGHALGIGHTSNDDDAPAAVRGQIMYKSFAPMEERRYLGASDFTAVCELDFC
jgi:hypothetical protein